MKPSLVVTLTLGSLLAVIAPLQPALCLDINGSDSKVDAAVDACSGTSTSLRHWATLDVRGVPVFLHQRLDRKGHFLIEPLLTLPDKADTLNASCVHLDRLTQRYYISFPVMLLDDEVLYQAKEQLRHVAPKSVTFMQLASAELLAKRLPGGWELESFRVSSEGRLGYLRINCPDHQKCVTLRSQLMRHEAGIFELALLNISAASHDNCVAIGNLTKQVTVPHASQLDVAAFARPKYPRNCSQSLQFYRDFYVDGRPLFVMREVGDNGGYWLEPLLTFNGVASAYRNSSGWPGLSLRLGLRESSARHAIAGRLRLLGNGGPLRFLHLVGYRLESNALVGIGVEGLRLAVDRESVHLRLLAPNDTEAGAVAMTALGLQISANPTLLFDALRFNFSFSADDACQTPYWTERRVATPHRSQYRVRELQRRASQPSSACVLRKQPQVVKISQHEGLPAVLRQRIDRGLQRQSDYLIEPLLFYEDQLDSGFDYARGAHYLSMNITLQSAAVLDTMRRNLTYLPARSLAFMRIRDLSLRSTVGISGVKSMEFYMSYDQRLGFLRLYCHGLAACAGLQNYLKYSELLLERLQLNVTIATPDAAECTGPEPIPKLIVGRTHLLDLAYLREKSPSLALCSDAAFPLVQAPLQPSGSCQLVVHRSLNLAGNLSYFVEPTFCFRSAERHYDYALGKSFLSLRLSLANSSLLAGVRDSVGASHGTGATVDFMQLWSLKMTSRTRLAAYEAGAFKASLDRSQAEFRIYCRTGNDCWKLHANLQDNNTVMLENFNLEITATLPSYDCWMPRPMRKQIGSPNATYFDLSYLNSKTKQLPGCPKELPIRLFALKVIANCPTFVYKREDSKAGFYVEPQFCFNGRVQYGYSYMTSSHYVSFGVDLNSQSVLESVAAQLTDLAPKRVAFLEVRKVNITGFSLGNPAHLLDGFFVTVDRSRGAFRVLCANRTSCRELGSNVSARPWILFERIQIESLMANGIDCELSTSTHQQPSSSVFSAASTHGGGFHLPLEILRLKLPTVAECGPSETPRPFQILTVDGCPVVLYRMPTSEGSSAEPEAGNHGNVLIEPLLCFHGNGANATARMRDYLTGDEYISIKLLVSSHSVLKAVQDHLALPPGTGGGPQFARLWDLRVTEEEKFNSLKVVRVGLAADQLTAEFRVACRGVMCQALMETLADEPADYLKSISLSVTNLLPTGKCHFKAPMDKRPITIGYSRSLQCVHDYLPTTTVSPKITMRMWMSQRCNSYQWTSCQLSDDGTHAYFFSRSLSNWDMARSTCRRLNGDLATIGSSSENRKIFTHLTGNSWIGMHRSGGSYVWVGPTSDNGYRNFPAGHNRNLFHYYDNSCVSMSSSTTRTPYPPYHYESGVWSKTACRTSLHFVCKFNMQVTL